MRSAYLKIGENSTTKLNTKLAPKTEKKCMVQNDSKTIKGLNNYKFIKSVKKDGSICISTKEKQEDSLRSNYY